MIVDERMTVFINSLDTGNSPFLCELEQEAKKDHVPIIRREMQSFLKVLLQMQHPVNILEVGTAVGFSTLLFCEYAPKEAKITTIEKYEKRIPVAKANFRKAGKEEQPLRCCGAGFRNMVSGSGAGIEAAVRFGIGGKKHAVDWKKAV